MKKRLVRPARLVVIFFVIAALLAVYFPVLYKLQIIDGAAYADEDSAVYTAKYPVAAVRGNIYDRNGVLLASSEVAYDLMVLRSAVLRSADPNAALLGIVETAEEFGAAYTDTFPMTRSGPFEFTAAMTARQRDWLDKYFEYFKLDKDISGSDFFVWIKDHYGIGYTTPLSDARKIIGVRWELEMRVIVNTDDYVFVRNADADLIAAMLERGYPGVYAAASSRRVYHTTSAAHLLGYVGAMSPEEVEEYTAKGYPMNALIGKSGAEAAFEELLRGTDGEMAVTTNAAGAVIGTEMTAEPKAGDNVYLTIDVGLQAAAEAALASTISEINAERKPDEELAEGGAIAVVDVNTGRLLAGASAPGYDVSTLNENIAALNADELRPLFNRLTRGQYEPGSTFKMVTSLAGLNRGKITPYTTITDQGKFTKYEGYQPVCWIYPYGTHGTLDVVGALENSCNYFYYVLGDWLGLDAIEETAQLFGLGERTGIEIAESPGILGTADYKRNELGEPWYAADTLQTAIGQGYNRFTPLQLAGYVSTIANGGTRYRVTLLDTVTTHDFGAVLAQTEPEALSVIDDADGYIDVLRRGMRAVARTGTASSMFRDYRIPVAAKTGTVQSDRTKINNGVFVCYAPSDDPKIAISVVVEKGGSGSSIMSAAKKVLDYYFTQEDMPPEKIVPEGGLLR
ncbi:MAG: hypothetical protein IK136_05430 [Oscillospiraceae bacterium]|nr:hypothetical protein [Oscillospiraceae bacterium]